MNPLLRSVHVPLFKQGMLSHSFISEGNIIKKKLTANKYVCVNDQTCSAKIYALLFAKLFFQHFNEPRRIRGQ